MEIVPSQSQQFALLADSLFGAGKSAASGLRIRFLQPDGGPVVTLAYLPDLLSPEDLRELLLKPIATGGPIVAPQAMAQQGRFPAPDVFAVQQPGRLLEGLLDGHAVLHVDGYPEALLIGGGQPSPPSPGLGSGAAPANTFGPDLGANRALIRRSLRSPYLRFLSVKGSDGSQSILAAVEGNADPAIVQAMAEWVRTLGEKRAGTVWWQGGISLLRLPPVVAAPSPEAAAQALRKGYVLLLTDRLPGACIGPATLPLLLGVPTDLPLLPPTGLWNPMIRVLQAYIALIQDAAFVAITSYHHSMLPGPFLVRLAQGRQDQPLPIVFEVLILEALDNGLWSLAHTVGGRRWTFVSLFTVVLATLTGFQAGLISAIPAVVCISTACFLQMLPTAELSRQIRIWRFFLVLAAAFIGMFGVALAAMMILIYLGVERRFGHRLRESPEVNAQ